MPTSTELKLLDVFTSEGIKKGKLYLEKVVKYHQSFHKTLAHQRSRVADAIRGSLLNAVEGPFEFINWQRVVAYQHTLTPLSVVGSVLSFGGRFNIGDINKSQFSPFPALYIAEDKLTALQEYLSKQIEPGHEQEALEFALMTPASTTNVSISGMISSIINLDYPNRLQGFVDIIKDFQVSNTLANTAKKLKLPPPNLVRDITFLMDSLLSPDWPGWPTLFSVPHPSQLFGQLVLDCGIEGILYPSKFTETNCLAIFPQNFKVGKIGSYVQLNDKAPKEIEIKKLDEKTWVKFQM